MSEEESNICKVCGGLLRFEWVMAFEQCAPREMRLVPHVGMIKLCPGHNDLDAPKPRHDGQLNDDDTHHVFHNNFNGIAISSMTGVASLTAKEALSLLAWLLQERELLGELARRSVSEEGAPHD